MYYQMCWFRFICVLILNFLHDTEYTSYPSRCSPRKEEKRQIAKKRESKEDYYWSMHNIDLTISYEWNEDDCTSKCNAKATLK